MVEEITYKKYYSYLFAFFYLVQGFVQGIPFLVFPPYLAKILGNKYDIAQWLIVASIGSFPWAIKLIIGIANDKWGSKRLGRRFPWIAGFGIFGAIWWFIMAVYLPTDETIYVYFAIYYFMTALGMAFADTALDGLILDVTPKSKLAKVQGFTWTCLLLGMGAGGIILGLIFLSLDAIPTLFILTGVLMIIACVSPKLIKELPYYSIKAKKFGRDVLKIFAKRKNWKVFLYVFFGAMTGLIILRFFNYLILISLGVISVDNTILSIKSGNAVDLLGWDSTFYVLNGIGTIIGSMTAGKYSDKNRRKSILLAYIIYMPFLIISIIPFVLMGDFALVLIYGLIGQVIFGAIQGALVVASQTINGDIARKEYPHLKTTYYALIISFWNGGQSFGQLTGGLLFSVLAVILFDFYVLYFILTVFCAVMLLISFVLFRSINPELYEFEHLIEGEEDKAYFA
ncbi:MAG: MFS transporter [Candidatus Lokiarchaeota archaeon]|nr:MFS transporter [Candidatus Lokiarchaeota archaeon]